MTKEKHNKLIKIMLSILATLTVLFVICAILDVFYRYPKANNMVRPEVLQDFNEGWKAEGMSAEILGGKEITLPITLENKKATVTIYKNIDNPAEYARKVIYMSNDRAGMIVKVNGETIFYVNTDHDEKSLSIKGRFFICLPEMTEPYKLEIQVIDYQGSLKLPALKIGSRYAVAVQMVKEDAVTLITITLYIVLSIFLFFVSLFIRKRIEDSIRILLVGLALFNIGIWGFTDSMLGVLFGINAIVLGNISYFSFMLLIVPATFFMWHTLEKKNNSLLLLGVISLLNAIVEIALSLYKIASLRSMLFINHVLIALSLITCIICGIRKLKTDKRSSIKLLAMSYIELGIVTIFAIFAYWKIGSAAYRSSMLVGALIFLYGLVGNLISGFVEVSEDKKYRIHELEIYERVSTVDALTGLGNRRAYEEKIKEVEQGLKYIDNAVLVMMDLNGLKYVNDTFGHATGDEMLVRASRIIRESFEDIGECFRIGGDEFAAIILDTNLENEELRAIFDRNLKKKNNNKDYKLSIAYGESKIGKEEDIKSDIDEWKREADINMYYDKRANGIGREDSEITEFRNIIDTMINVEEAKDEYTAHHSERVCAISVYIAKKLGLSERTIHLVKEAAQLHDIGKIGIDDSILTKPGRLTDEEFAIMKTHTTIGAKILSKSKHFTEVSSIVEAHHERYDGKGYPNGLSKKDIPIGARIIAIGDSIDAMTSKRCYRDPMPLDVCRLEIEKNIGKMYDPAIASIAIDNWKDIEEIVLSNPNRLESYYEL